MLAPMPVIASAGRRLGCQAQRIGLRAAFAVRGSDALGVLGFISFSPTYVDFLGQVLGMNETEGQAA